MAFAGGFNTRINGEDNYTATRRGEDTSRMEAKLESQLEGLHAEDHPDLMNTIKTAQEAEAMAQEEVDEANQKWLAAQADGSVKAMQGAVDIKKIVPQEQDNEIEALRKLRLAQMRGRAEARQHWLAKGHGQYVKLEQESSFLEKLPQHERAVCAICAAGSMDGQMLHAHMRALCQVHVETFFCHLDPESAPVMMGMVDVGRLPALLLCKEGKVVHCLHGIDRSFTSEGVAYELAQHNLLDFEEGIVYGKAGAGCTTATANRTSALPRSPPRQPAARRRADDDDDDDDDNEFNDSGAESDDLSE